MRNFGLQDNKKIVFRYRGEGKFAVARKRRQDEAIERNNAYQKMVSTKAGINEYISLTKNIGKKQYTKLKNKLNTMTRG